MKWSGDTFTPGKKYIYITTQNNNIIIIFIYFFNLKF